LNKHTSDPTDVVHYYNFLC